MQSPRVSSCFENARFCRVLSSADAQWKHSGVLNFTFHCSLTCIDWGVLPPATLYIFKTLQVIFLQTVKKADLPAYQAAARSGLFDAGQTMAK
jgi:hypothetical protein